MVLTVAELKNAKVRDKAYQLSDALGLYLYILPSGGKSWRFKYRIGDREHRMTFGLFPEVSLADARAKRDEARALLREGCDPARDLRAAKTVDLAAEAATFQSIAADWLADSAPQWSASHYERVRFRLERDLYPALGKTPVALITPQAVLKVLRKIEQRGSIETAKRVKSYIVSIFRRAKAEQLVGDEMVVSIYEPPHVCRRLFGLSYAAMGCSSSIA